MKRIWEITAGDNASLNRIADFLVAEKQAFLESAEDVKFHTGGKPLLGSGEARVYKIVIVYKNPDEEQQQDIDEILALAKDSGDGADEIDFSVRDE